MDKHSGGISKGADTSPQPKQTNKQTASPVTELFFPLPVVAVLPGVLPHHTEADTGEDQGDEPGHWQVRENLGENLSNPTLPAFNTSSP